MTDRVAAERHATALASSSLPTVEAIAAAPIDALPALVMHLAALQTAAAARLASDDRRAAPVAPRQPDRNLSIQEAAERAGMSVDWFYRHARSLPFARRIGRKRLFSEQGLALWMKARGVASKCPPPR